MNNENRDTGSIADMLEEFEEEILDERENEDEDEVEEEETEETEDTDDETSDDSDEDEDENEDEDEEDELTLLRAQLAERDATIAEIAKGRVAADDDEEEEETIPDQWEDTEFVDDEFDMEELTPKSLNMLLNKAAQAGANFGAKQGSKKALLAMPEVVKHNINVQTTIQESVKTFYSKNKDLLNFKGAVSAVTQELAAEHPDWPVNKLFAEAGKETRKRLGIKENRRPKKTKKKTIRSQRGKGKTKSLKGLENEIDEMLAV